jgi:hypothetical protein
VNLSTVLNRQQKEREKNPLAVGGWNLDYYFGTKLHQDYYASAIIKKDYPIARSEYINWGFLSIMEDPKIAEIIRECKRKNVYDIMGFAKSWNNEVIAQFYATCYFTTWKNEKIVHWMTEGKWFGITITQFAYLLGFDEEDIGRVKIHRDHDMDKVDMNFMYIPGQEWNFG